MRKIFLEFAALVFLGAVLIGVATVALANPYNYKILRVIDGDTVEFQAEFLPGAFKQSLSLRIYGVDTPEKGPRATCPEENMMSLRAKLFVEQEISNAKKVEVFIRSWDKFGGRVLGDVIVDGEALSVKLIANGYAAVYNGRGTKTNWCK